MNCWPLEAELVETTGNLMIYCRREEFFKGNCIINSFLPLEAEFEEKSCELMNLRILKEKLNINDCLPQEAEAEEQIY